jgi:hypothetical protein
MLEVQFAQISENATEVMFGSNERRSILITKALRAPQLRLTLERRFRQGDHRAAQNSYLCIYFDMEVIEVNRKFVFDGG